VRTLDGHAHWVNTLSLNTDYALRSGPFDEKGNQPDDEKQRIAVAKDKYDKIVALNPYVHHCY
jgi:ribosome assembly protein 4